MKLRLWLHSSADYRHGCGYKALCSLINKSHIFRSELLEGIWSLPHTRLPIRRCREPRAAALTVWCQLFIHSLSEICGVHYWKTNGRMEEKVVQDTNDDVRKVRANQFKMFQVKVAHICHNSQVHFKNKMLQKFLECPSPGSVAKKGALLQRKCLLFEMKLKDKNSSCSANIQLLSILGPELSPMNKRVITKTRTITCLFCPSENFHFSHT